MGWLKGVMSSQQHHPEENNHIKEAPTEVLLVEQVQEGKESTGQSQTHSFFSKDNQDKVTLDLIVSLENMLNDRQLLLYKNKGLEEKLYSEKETTSRLKHENVKKEQQLLEKSKEITALETKLTNKQMSYDQLLEDYKEYQQNSNLEFEKVSSQLEKEINKYNRLNEESTKTQYQNLLHIKQLEEKIRELEVENQKYAASYDKILEEKTQLMQTINDFTERMSFSFGPKQTASNSESE